MFGCPLYGVKKKKTFLYNSWFWNIDLDFFKIFFKTYIFILIIDLTRGNNNFKRTVISFTNSDRNLTYFFNEIHENRQSKMDETTIHVL